MAADPSRSIELDLPAVPWSAPRARHAVVRMLSGLDVDPWAVGVVVSEAVTNVVLHAYRDRAPGRIRLTATLDGDVLTLVVGDDGIGISPNPNSPGLGVGLAIIDRLAEHVDVQTGSGTRLLARLRLAPAI